MIKRLVLLSVITTILNSSENIQISKTLSQSKTIFAQTGIHMPEIQNLILGYLEMWEGAYSVIETKLDRLDHAVLTDCGKYLAIIHGELNDYGSFQSSSPAISVFDVKEKKMVNKNENIHVNAKIVLNSREQDNLTYVDRLESLATWNFKTNAIKTNENLFSRTVAPALAFSFDKKFLAAGLSNGVAILNTANNQLIKTIKREGTFNAKAVAYSPCGTFLAFDDNYYELHVLNLATETTSIKKKLSEPIEAIAYSAIGDLIAVCLSKNANNTICIIDAKTGAILKKLKNSEFICFSKCGKFFVIYCTDYRKKLFKIEIWDSKTITLMRVLSDSDSSLRSLNFSDNGKFIIAAYRNGIINCWKTQAGEIEEFRVAERN